MWFFIIVKSDVIISSARLIVIILLQIVCINDTVNPLVIYCTAE